MCIRITTILLLLNSKCKQLSDVLHKETPHTDAAVTEAMLQL